jgi:DNA invertase Pin-like site-specific DNA recombinase
MHIATDDPEHHISKFVRWAHEKIEKEISLNDKIEKEFGEKAIPKEKSRCSYSLTTKQKQDKLDQIDALKKAGSSLAAACREIKIHQTTYYKWQKLINQSK